MALRTTATSSQRSTTAVTSTKRRPATARTTAPHVPAAANQREQRQPSDPPTSAQLAAATDLELAFRPTFVA